MSETSIQKKEVTNFGLSWTFATGTGAMLIQATFASYYSLFMTDYVGIAAGTASVIMLVANLWDAINDPIMGVLADRTRTRWGRYRSYFLWAPAVLMIVSMMAFLNPQFASQNAKTAWVAVFFILYGMAVTVIQMTTYALVPAYTKSLADRNKIFTWGAIAISVAFTFASSFTLNWEKALGGFMPLMAIYGIITIITFIWLFRASKENYLLKAEKRSVVADLKTVFKHPPVYPVLLINLFCSLGYGLMFSTSVFYVMYFLIRPDLIPVYMMVISIGALVSNMVVMPISLKLFKHAHVVLLWSLSGCAILYLLCFFVGASNFVLLCVLSFIATAFSAQQIALGNLVMVDSIDYVQLKENVSMNGTLSAIKGFAYKCGTTLNSAGTLAILAVSGYVTGAVGHQPPSAMFAFNALRFLIPAVLAALTVILCVVYPIKKYFPEIEAMKAAMKASDEEN